MSRNLASLKRPAAMMVAATAGALFLALPNLALAEPEASQAPDAAKQSAARSAPKPATQASQLKASKLSTARSATKPTPQKSAASAAKQSAARAVNQAPQMAANDAVKQSLTRSAAAPAPQAAKPDAAKQSAARSDIDSAPKAATPDAKPGQALAMRAGPPDSPKQAAQAPLERKAVKGTRSSQSWFDWLFGQ